MAGAEQHDYLVLYGSLKRGFPNRAELGIEDSIEYEGPCASERTRRPLGVLDTSGRGLTHVDTPRWLCDAEKRLAEPPTPIDPTRHHHR